MTFWCATKAIPICNYFLFKKILNIIIDVLKAHESDITHMQWFEKDRILITSAKEKCIKVLFFSLNCILLSRYGNYLKNGEIKI